MTALKDNQNPHRGFCIFLDTFFQGPTLAVTEEENRPCVFSTELDAQREIADNMMTRLRQFLDGERDFDDAITVEEYVVPVTVLADGTIRTNMDGCWVETLKPNS